VKTFAQLIGVRPETAPAIEAHTRELLASLEAILETQPYLLGGRPSLADCALMGPLYAHLYMDAVPARLLRETAPLTCQWIERMNHPHPDGFGVWLAGTPWRRRCAGCSS
jgi:glutathione S-transferase